MPETDRLPLYSDHLDDLLVSYRAAKWTADQTAQQAVELRDQIAEILEDNELDIYMQNGEKAVQIIWTEPVRFDAKSFRQAYPDIAREYDKQGERQRRVIIK